MLLLDVREDGRVAEVGLAAGALVVPAQQLGLQIGFGTIHIIDYGFNNLF